MPVTVIVMVWDVLVRIRRNLVDVTGGMNGKLNAHDASPRQIGGMSHAREAGKDQHQTCQEGQKRPHARPFNTEGFPRHCNNSAAGSFTARHGGRAPPAIGTSAADKTHLAIRSHGEHLDVIDPPPSEMAEP